MSSSGWDGPVLQDEFGIQQERQLQRLFGVRSMAEMHMPQDVARSAR